MLFMMISYTELLSEHECNTPSEFCSAHDFFFHWFKLYL